MVRGMPLLPLSPDELLSTTRAVRKRLDFERPVPDELVTECLELAMQSPSGSNNPTMQFVVVRDPDLRAAVGAIYRQCYSIYQQLPGIYIRTIDKGSDDANAQQQRSADSADYLADHMGDAPVLVVACSTSGRLDGVPAVMSVNAMANVQPAMWSFMLAARARGLGTCWTSVHLFMEQQVADVLGIPFDQVQQVCLTPVAFTKGTDFRSADRPASDSMIHWDRW
jgi:nitroreductase